MGKHENHDMHPHSIEAHDAELPKLTGRKVQIYEFIKQHGPCTDRDVCEGLKFYDMNAVRPRITEMIPLYLKEAGARRDKLTKRTVRVVEVSHAG